jgi:hypothetical protein
MREVLQILDSDDYSEFFWAPGENKGRLLG